jgi:SM-20-related protein
MLNGFVRRDEIRWLETANPEERGWLNWIEQLRAYLNRRLLLGLFSFEGHFAHYAPGAFYKKHMDAFKGESNRVLTVVLYLNWNWQPDDGGEMLMYREQETEPFARVMPQMGRMAVFLSEEFPHEVLPAKRDRYSIAGWYRINASTPERVDPPR